MRLVTSRIGAVEAQACGEHAVGYGTGWPNRSRAKPQKSSGSRPSEYWAASSRAVAIRCA
ncbi:hypothetical protein [Pseudarthrobacter sp. PvP090]|uniref:hypothetical protein n=1 Tax=Pseudarthrobacter sp. PvP090 TaxID=3156393 RepID=UPI00339770B3